MVQLLLQLYLTRKISKCNIQFNIETLLLFKVIL